jgi:hypothetical protein
MNNLNELIPKYFNFLKEIVDSVDLHSKSFVDNFKRITSLNWLEKISSRRYLDSLIVFQRRMKISKHSVDIFQWTSNFIFIKILFQFFKSTKLFWLNDNQRLKSN